MVDVLDVMLGPIVMWTKTLVSLSASLANSSPFHLYVNTALMFPAINKYEIFYYNAKNIISLLCNYVSASI